MKVITTIWNILAITGVAFVGYDIWIGHIDTLDRLVVVGCFGLIALQWLGDALKPWAE